MFHFPSDLVTKIRRFHRREPGLIPSLVFKRLKFNHKLTYSCKGLFLLLSFGRSSHMIDLHISHLAYLLLTLCK